MKQVDESQVEPWTPEEVLEEILEFAEDIKPDQPAIAGVLMALAATIEDGSHEDFSRFVQLYLEERMRGDESRD